MKTKYGHVQGARSQANFEPVSEQKTKKIAFGSAIGRFGEKQPRSH